MRWLRSIAREVFGLFVDDASFALAILVWVVLACWASADCSGRPRWTGPALFSGLARS